MKRLLAPPYALNVALLLCIVAVVLLVGSKAITFGSSSGGWTYGYLANFQLRPVLAAIGLSLVLAALFHLARDLIKRHQIAVLALWIPIGLAAQLFLHSFYPYSIAEIVRSNGANSFYDVSLRYRAYDFLNRYHQLMQAMPLHTKDNMPGKVLLYQGLRFLTNDPRWLGITIVAIADFGGVLLYFIVSAVYASREIALASLVLYLFTPATIYFMPILNVVSVVPLLACLLALVRFLRSRRRILAVLFGVGLYAAILFDPLPLALGLFFVALAGRSWWRSEVRTRDVLWLLSFGLSGFLAAYGVMFFWVRFDLLTTLMAVWADAHAFNASHRPYEVWLWADLLEFFFNAGALASLLCLVYGATLLLRAPLSARTCAADLLGRSSPGPMLLIALLATIAALDLLGLNRGEVVRLWIFMTVFVEVVAAGFSIEMAGKWTIDIVLAGSIIPTAVTISMVGFIV
jgi:hypothetical protein